MVERIGKEIGMGILKFFNVVVLIPLSLATTVIVVVMGFINIILLSTPIAFIFSFFVQEIDFGVGPNNIFVKFISVIICFLLGWSFKDITRVYTKKYFKALEAYLKKSFIS